MPVLESSSIRGVRDVKGHTWRCTEQVECDVPPAYWTETGPTKLTVNVGEGGEVRGLSTDKGFATVRIHSRQDYPIVLIPISCIDIGTALVGEWNVEHGQVRVSRVFSIDPTGTVNRTGVSEHIHLMLVGIAEQRARIPDVEPYMPFLTDVGVNQTTDHMRNNIDAASPQILIAMNKDDFDIWSVVDAAPTFADWEWGVFDKRTYCGVYVIVYWDFEEDSAYADLDFAVYVGQSNDMAGRARGHRNAGNNENNPGYNTEHYRCLRKARKWRIVRVLVQDPDEGGGEAMAEKLRDLYEVIWMMKLRTFHTKMLKWNNLDVHSTAEGIAHAATHDYARKELCLLYDDIATASTKSPGNTYADPTKPDRKKSFGNFLGLNCSCPVGTLEKRRFERTIYSLSQFPQQKRMVFRRPGYKSYAADPKKGDKLSVYSQAGTYEHGGDANFTIKTPVGGEYPNVGDYVYPVWEVMTEGVHPVPYFRVGDIGCWTNWPHVLKLGFKLLWKSNANRKWYYKYLQSGVKASFKDPKKQGSQADYCWGIAIYAMLMRSTWPKRQSFVPKFGRAHVVEVTLDQFEQKAVCSALAKPLADLKGPVFSFRTAVQLTKQLSASVGGSTWRLENVDGPWQRLQWDWLEEHRARYQQEAMAAGKTEKDVNRKLKHQKKDKLCDCCWIAYNVSVGSASICEGCNEC